MKHLIKGLLVAQALLLLPWLSVQAQNPGAREIRNSRSASKQFVQAHIDTTSLRQFSRELLEKSTQKKAEAVAKARSEGWPLTISADGGFAKLVRLDSRGLPVYYSTDNTISATTIGTDQVHAGGVSGLALSGSSLIMGLWDQGSARVTHESYVGRVFSFDGGTTSEHATHVCGTMIGDGILNAGSKGMAPGGFFFSYDWDNDDAEMVFEASNGMLVSNHSYGSLSGWSQKSNGDWHWYGNETISTTESDHFGRYNSQAVNWDDIVYQAPYYLPFKSAGNDRNASGTTDPHFHHGGSTLFTDSHLNDCAAKGGYDCIPTYGVAKNIMTVGAVEDIPNGYSQVSDVVITSFSGYGPADDGRIKPDITANGQSLWSAVSAADNTYGLKSGTSMSTPSASGSAGLLQEHYAQTHSNSYMLASTLKGLILHTANEAGIADGPDYIFGWGLMNTAGAADIISKDTLNDFHIQEFNLQNGTALHIEVEATGTEPLVATICWTDEAGTAQPESSVGHNNPAPNLINDLDLRITQAASVHHPYILDPANPANAASTGDNFRDNVEQVHIANPIPGEVYTIEITHEGSFTNVIQQVSVIISGMEDGCEANVVLTTPISGTEEHAAAFELTASNTIEGTADATFQAGNNIRLEPGFKVDRGAHFIAEIEDCHVNSVATVANHDEAGQQSKFSEEEASDALATVLPENSLEAYPNPFTGLVNVQYDLARTSVVQISVYDLVGRPVTAPMRQKQPAGKHLHLIQGENFPAGFYTVVMEVEGNRYSKKICKR